MSVKQRIAHALAANAFGQAVTIGTQILLTPLFFRQWGAGLYGEWLILSSVPAYLTMVDMGVGSAAGNEMTILAGAGNQAGAQRTYRGAGWVALGASGLVILLGLLIALTTAYWQFPHTRYISSGEAGQIVALLSLTVALAFPAGVVSAGFRAAGHNALGVTLSNTSRLLEGIGMGVALLVQQGPLMLCATSLVIKGLMLVLQYVWLRQICSWLYEPRLTPDLTLVRRLFVPSIGFMAFPLGNAIALQGPILVIGHFFGGPAVAMFSALRTLSRLPIQIVNTFNSSVWPEMSRAYGAGDLALLRSLHRGTWGVTLLLVLVSGIVLVALGEAFAHAWLGTAAPFDQTVMFALVLITVLTAVWNASSVVMSAVNAHAGFGACYVFVNTFCLGSAWWMTGTTGWVGLLTWLVVAEVVLLMWVFPRVLHLTADRPWSFFQGSYQAIWRQTTRRFLP